MAILINGITREFRGRSILSSGRLEVEGPGLIALRGPNGSGKTTLLRILATLTEPTSGDARLAGHSVVQDSRQVRSVIGFVPATDGGFFRKLTGYENLVLFGALRGLKRAEVRGAISRWRESLPLERALETPFATASTGMRQALSLCRALLHDPTILLLDEPTRSLDPAFATRLRESLRELAATKTVLFSSHLEAEWRQADSLWEIDDGELRCSATS